MLKSQTIMLEQSKRRERLAELQKADELSDDGRNEMRSITDQYAGAEVELRAALVLEDAERAKISEPDKSETDFGRECRAFSLASAVGALSDGRPMTGREAEVSAELEQRHGEGVKGARVPWKAMIERRSLETRADAVTDSAPGTSAELASRPTMQALQRFFEASAAQRFGVSVMQVAGAPRFPEITDGTGLAWVAEGQGADAGTITTIAKEPTMRTATGRYLVTRQAVRQNMALESILRRDLSEVQREGLDRAVFQGSGADNQPSGFETVLTGARTADLADKATFSDFLLRAVEVMESAKLADPGQVRVAMAPIVMATLMDSILAGTAVSEWDRVKAALPSLTVSSQVSARGARDATDKGASTVYFGAGQGNAFVTAWGSPELVVDPYSESKTGRIALTMFAFVDVLIQRTGTHFFKLTGVQDRT